MYLPSRIFITGAPGSCWSGVARHIEDIVGFNVTDRSSEREYDHHAYNGHIGAYFGTGMEFPAELNLTVLDAPFSGEGTRFYKSHEWAYKLPEIVDKFSDSWILMVLRPDQICFNWWKKAGGWDIIYPNYSWYENDEVMLEKIIEQNTLIKEFTNSKVTWSSWSQQWVLDNFGIQHNLEIQRDIEVAIFKND